MKSFLMSAVLQRTVLDTMSFTVRASNLEHAYHIARDFMTDFPNKNNPHSKDVPFCVVENRDNLSTQIMDLSEQDELDD